MAELPSLKNRALRLLSTREYSRWELEQRLIRHAQEPDTVSAVLDDLTAKGFLSEQRVLESVLHRRTPQWGGVRIRQELHAKGLDAQAINQALQTLRATELERAIAVWRKKFASDSDSGRASDNAQRAKQARFLSQRGFDADVIYQVMRHADKRDPDSTDG